MKEEDRGRGEKGRKKERRKGKRDLLARSVGSGRPDRSSRILSVPLHRQEIPHFRVNKFRIPVRCSRDRRPCARACERAVLSETAELSDLKSNKKSSKGSLRPNEEKFALARSPSIARAREHAGAKRKRENERARAKAREKEIEREKEKGWRTSEGGTTSDGKRNEN